MTTNWIPVHLVQLEGTFGESLHPYTVSNIWNMYIQELQQLHFNPLGKEAMSALITMDLIAKDFYAMLDRFVARMEAAKEPTIGIESDFDIFLRRNTSRFTELSRPQQILGTMRFLTGVPTYNRSGDIAHKRYIRKFLPFELMNSWLWGAYKKDRIETLEFLLSDELDPGEAFVWHSGPRDIEMFYSKLAGWHFFELEAQIPTEEHIISE